MANTLIIARDHENMDTDAAVAAGAGAAAVVAIEATALDPQRPYSAVAQVRSVPENARFQDTYLAEDEGAILLQFPHLRNGAR